MRKSKLLAAQTKKIYQSSFFSLFPYLYSEEKKFLHLGQIVFLLYLPLYQLFRHFILIPSYELGLKTSQGTSMQAGWQEGFSVEAFSPTKK